MRKRVAAGVLWFLAAWSMAAMAAFVLSVSSGLPMLVGVIAGVVVVVDPLGRLWIAQEQMSPPIRGGSPDATLAASSQS